MSVTKSVWADWKNHPVTVELMDELNTNMEHYVAELVRDIRDRDIDRDIYLRAYIAVARDVRGFFPEIKEEDENAAN